MKYVFILILTLVINSAAGCNSFGNNSYHTTSCYDKGYRQTWNTSNYGSISTTYYSSNKGTRGTTNQYNWVNGNYNRTYRNNHGYRSTTTKTGNCYFFSDNQGNHRSKCY